MSAALFDSPGQVGAFSRALRTQAVGKNLRYSARTQSTNDLAVAAARGGAEHGAVFVADRQDGGRGRRGRAWHCPSGMGLLFSVIVRPGEISLPPAECGWIPLAVGLAVAEGLASACELAVTFKWPNDIVLPCAQPPGWKKLGGILCESQLQEQPDRTAGVPPAAHSGYVVAGIGLNLNQGCADFPPELAGVASSVLIETGRTSVRQAVFAAVLEALEARLRQFQDAAARHALKETVERRMREWWTPGHEIRLRSPAGDERADSLRGTFAGLDAFGRLKLLVGGCDRAVADAEVLAVCR